MTDLYLSQLWLNPRSREAWRDLADVQGLHRTLMRAFPDAVATRAVGYGTGDDAPGGARAAVGRELSDKLHADETAAATKAALAYFKQKGWKTRVITRVGTAGDEIAKAAGSGKFDLVIMGSHGHGALGALLMGSAAQRVLANCGVPVLLIR